MLLPTRVVLTLTQATISATEDPPAPPSHWMLPVAALAAAFSWWVHWRWRTGRYFMSRYTTAEREKAKFAFYGPAALPAAIGCTAAIAMLGIWEFWGLPTTAWAGFAFLALAAVFVGAGAGPSRNGGGPASDGSPSGSGNDDRNLSDRPCSAPSAQRHDRALNG